MGRLLNLLKRFFSKTSAREIADTEQLRLAFQERYHNFKLLLNANNKSLEIMSEMESALQGQRPFGMSFVRAGCTAVSVNVLRMIKNLDALSPGKYLELPLRFNDIKQNIDQILSQRKLVLDKRFVILFDAIDKETADLVGNKMANLGEIKNRVGLLVPEGFVITSFAYEEFLKENDLQIEIDRLIQTAEFDNVDQLYRLSAEIQKRITLAGIPEALRDEIIAAYAEIEQRMGKKITLALRSSALGEDAPGSSFAGQYHSELNVSKENIFQAYKEVVASKYSLTAIAYRLNRGFKDEDISMSVGCMAMVDALCGGVTYSKSPIDFRDDDVFISAAWGLPKAVVDGSISCDLFIVARSPEMKIRKSDIREKGMQYVCFPEEGVCRMEMTGEKTRQPSINHEQACKLAEIAVRLEAFYGTPQDIEWAVTQDGALYVLQCRPLQRLENENQPRIASQEDQKDEDALIAGGTTASPGVASGPVFIVDKGVDVLRFPEGAVLVTRQALPRWAPLVNRSAAVITEQGSFAGHLANVAREFGIPALFGAAEVTRLLQEGRTVTVDAGNHVIYDGEIPSLLAHTRTKKNLMAGSPVFKTLQEVSRHIVPLNLLDPDDNMFRPVNCKTFHDITRFVHEKSVQEMFDFGKTHHFSERSSKQLYYHVPMQWWILNLDDGFKEEVQGKYVHLDNIVSIPMLAFWKGFAAIAWDGPPAIDGKGFMSVLYRSTTNTALTTGVRSSYAERNYFMISKHYCSLSSRLGYHFSIMEAMISERPIENYVSFQFKGGAADFERRLKRVCFIGEILETHGFGINIKEDMLIGRIEGHEMDFMKTRLEILGYLTLHTRQLDMIMANEAALAHYRSKIDKDIQTLLNAQ